MTDNKRAADDAIFDAMVLHCEVHGYPLEPEVVEELANVARAALSSRADGGKGEAVFPERDESKPAEQQGIFRKFEVRRVDGSDQPGGKHYGCRYFVLDMDHDAHAPAALRTYADSCAASHPQLTADLRAEFGAAPQAECAPIAPRADADTAGAKLTVWYGPMPESNGKTNWTAILHRGDVTEGITIDQSEYPDRTRYEADRMRWMIGELAEEPWVLDYDADKHSGYVAAGASNERADAEKDAALTDKQIESGWRHTFSTDNPYCPCNLKSFTKAVRWAEHAILAAKEKK